ALKASLREFRDRRVQDRRARGEGTLLLRARFALPLAVTNGLGGALGATLVHYPPCCRSPTDVLGQPARLRKCSFLAKARLLMRRVAPPWGMSPPKGALAFLHSLRGGIGESTSQCSAIFPFCARKRS